MQPETRCCRMSYPLIVALALLPVAAAQTRPTRTLTGKVAELNLRNRVIAMEQPIFPPEAVAQGKGGVAVAEIEVDESGSVDRVTIVESPAPSIEESVKRAVRLWRFQPFEIFGKPARFTSKLTFYFVLRDGEARVYAPRDAPYVGRWPETPPR